MARQTSLGEASPAPAARDVLAPLRFIPRPKKERLPNRYRIHQYWSRKPWYVVRSYIERFTKPGQTVLDPFVGSGVTVCESLAIGRNSIGVDRNPIARLIS